jgi:SAM-dependent methyltransferase
MLKTDLFEEAYGADQLLFELGSRCGAAIAFDISYQTVARAKANCPAGRVCHFLVTDLRDIALASNSTDLIVSNSTLDHFETEADFRRALSELVRILRPGGQIIITVDNTLNPLYWPLRWFGHSQWAPFPLGYAPSPKGLVRHLRQANLEVEDTAGLIHNPRLLSTALFLAMRRAFGPRANSPVQMFLRLFARLEHLPTRSMTACFVAASARKPSTQQ